MKGTCFNGGFAAQKRRWKKSLGLLAMLVLSLLVFSACAENGESAVNDEIIANYAYVATLIDVPSVPSHLQGAMAHGDRIYYYYVDHHWPTREEDWENWEPGPPDLVIHSVQVDGSDPQRVAISMTGDSVDVAGLHITEAGHFGMILISRNWEMMDGGTTVTYKEFNAQGAEVSSQDISGIVPPGSGWFQIERVFFADDGHAALLAWEDRGSAIYLLDASRNPAGRLELDSHPRGITQLRDGRVVAFDSERDGDSWSDILRVIDFEAGEWGESLPVTVGNVRNLFPAEADAPYDLYFDDGTHLFGYHIASGERFLRLNWIEAELAADWGYYLCFLDDGRLAVVSGNWVPGADDLAMELLVLTRTPRAEIPHREIITLGGFGIWGDIRNDIVEFNRSSQTHQIQVRDYMIYSTNDNWNAGLIRFQTEMIAGQGPDIVWGHPMNYSNLMDRGLLVDLYTFIDADPQINRSDFFANILEASEAADGTLPMISNAFGIQTMIGMEEAVGHIENWTFSDMLALLEQTDLRQMPHVLGEWMTGDNFLSMALMFSGTEFIDWGTMQANLNSDAFAHLLEVAALLPRGGEDEMMVSGRSGSEYALMLRGEQLLNMAHIWEPRSFQEFSGALGDIVVLGVPTQEGGAHVVHPGQGFGISAAGNQQEAAWDFLRQLLLPEATISWQIPLRIDLYEAMIEEAMTPDTWTDEDGVEHEQMLMSIWIDDNMFIDIYAMTEEEAQALREIVESASLLGRFNETVMEMVQEEILPFFAGDRTAADTARILQNRIQTYLNEQRR